MYNADSIAGDQGSRLPSHAAEQSRAFRLILAALGAIVLGVLAHDGWGTEGIRLVIRATARTSLALFLAAFLASTLAAVWPSPLTRWQLRNRRALGLAFATSHAVHLGAIVALASTDPETLWRLSNSTSVVAGGTGYLAIALLVSTSTDRAMAWLGAASWQRLHTWGSAVVWVVLLTANAKRIPVSGWYAVPVMLLLAAAALKVSVLRPALDRR